MRPRKGGFLIGMAIMALVAATIIYFSVPRPDGGAETAPVATPADWSDAVARTMREARDARSECSAFPSQEGREDCARRLEEIRRQLRAGVGMTPQEKRALEEMIDALVEGLEVE